MRKVTKLIAIILLLLISAYPVTAQTTGKIAGIIEDASTGEPLAGANVYIEGQNLGSSTDLEGSFFIINVYILEVW